MYLRESDLTRVAPFFNYSVNFTADIMYYPTLKSASNASLLAARNILLQNITNKFRSESLKRADPCGHMVNVSYSRNVDKQQELNREKFVKQ